MVVTFNLNYQTAWGQELHVSGSCKLLGVLNEEKSIPMVYTGNGGWSLSLEVPEMEDFSYGYLLKRNGKVIRREFGKLRKFIPKGRCTTYRIFDQWRDLPSEKAFFSLPFTEVFYRHERCIVKSKHYSKTITLKVYAPKVLPSHKVGVIGKSKGLGDWQVEKVIPMECPNFPEWEVCLDASKISLPMEYKFVILDELNQVVVWEQGENRHFYLQPLIKEECAVIAGHVFNHSLPRWRGAGVAIPVFSLRSDDGMGIGEFLDLRKVAEWASQTGQKFIQILPINDTTMTKTWVDTYPYKSISIFALNPIYLNVERMGRLNSETDMSEFALIKRELNSLENIDFEAVFRVKWDYFRKIYDQEGITTLESKEFEIFFAKNREWLEPYAAFCYLRDKFGTPDFSQWGKYAKYDASLVAPFGEKRSAAYKDIAISYFIQFHLDKQLTEAVNYAHKCGVALKGDIPIGVSRYSVETWVEPLLFNMNGQAGAPPDDFSALGQNWGFPTYNWEEMEKDGYGWWKKRFMKMADYFDAYRIDHILGFFRIWEIPLHSVQGLLGCFNPAIPYTRDEIQYFGLYFNDDRFLKPFIRRHFLESFFGEYTQPVIDNFLVDKGFGIFDLHPNFATQRQVEAFFAGKTDEQSIRIRDGLYGLINEVLFIRDPKQPYNFHPRISAQFTYSYKHLNEGEKRAYDRLYSHFFYERHTEFWKWEAMKKLPALSNATDMLACGEDLGMIPDSVPDVMHWLQILSLEIQRMPKDPKVLFGNTHHYPYNSVCTTSTHDMSTIRGWWEEDRVKAQNFYNHVLNESDDAPFFCEPWICERIVDLHLSSPSMLCILPLQDWLSMDSDLRRKLPDDERINIPANPNHYWRYRMHLSLDELNESETFNQKIKEKLKYYSR